MNEHELTIDTYKLILFKINKCCKNCSVLFHDP